MVVFKRALTLMGMTAPEIMERREEPAKAAPEAAAVDTDISEAGETQEA
jgi:hypothetical protein